MKTIYSIIPGIILLLLFRFFTMEANAQIKKDKELQIGDTVSEVTIQKLIRYKTPSLKFSSLKGKVIVLDFWATWCSPCLKSMPGLDSLQKRFKDQLVVLTVTNEDESEVFKKLGSMPSLRNVYLPVIAGDTLLHALFPHRTVPHDIVIGKDGIVKAITEVDNITESSVTNFINEKELSLPEKKVITDFDYNQSMIYDDRLRKLMLYQGFIARQVSGLPSKVGRSGGTREHGDTRLYATNETLLNMYRTALLERLSGPEQIPDNRIQLFVKDSSKYIRPPGLRPSEWYKDNMYCYDYTIAPTSSKSIYSYLKEDLDRYFGVRSGVEQMNIECYLLKAKNHNSFSITSNRLFDQGINEWSLRDVGITEFLQSLNIHTKLPVINDTGYNGNINISVRASSLRDMESLNKELQLYGLYLKKGRRNMEVIRITEN